MVHFITGGSGYGKSYELFKSIVKGYDTGDNLYTIVPEQFSFEFDKKLYNSVGAEIYNRVHSMTFTTLAQEVLLKLGGKTGEYADDMSKTVFVYMAVKNARENGWFNFYRKNTGNGFVHQVEEVIYELRKSGISAEKLMEKSSEMGGQTADKVRDIAVVYNEYEKILMENGLKDSLTDITESAALANINGYFDGAVVFIDEFESFTGDEYELLDVIIAQAREVYVSLRSGNLSEREYSLFETVNKTFADIEYIIKKYGKKHSITALGVPHRFKSDELCHIEKSILRNTPEVYAGKAENTVKVIEAKGLYSEAEYVCAEIRRLVIEECYKYRDIAILSRQLSDYTGIFEAAFERYDIPYFMDVKKSILNTSVMVFIISALEFAANKVPDTAVIMNYAKSQLTGIGYNNIAMLENYCFKWNIDGKLWLDEFCFDENKEAEKVRAKLIKPLIELKNKLDGVDGNEICHEIYNYLNEIGVPKNISGLAQSYKDSGYIYMAREIKKQWSDLMDVLDVLAVTLKGVSTGAAQFKDIFVSMIKKRSYSVPPQSLDAVIAASAQTARLNSPKAVFVIGMNDGIFPGNGKLDGLIGESEKELLNDAGVKFSRTAREVIADERFVAYKALTSASDRLYMSYSLTDNTGKARYPSFIINQAEHMFGERIKVFADSLSADFYSSTYRSAYYTYVQGLNRSYKGYNEIKRILSEDSAYKTKLAFLEEALKSSDFRINNVELTRELFGERLKISASNFENYNKCHFKFFCENGLRIYQRTKRDINAVEKGNIVHYCLEKMVSSFDKNIFINLSVNEINNNLVKFANEYREKFLGGQSDKTSRFEAAFSYTVKGMEKLVLHMQNELRQSEFVPVNFELKIDEGKGSSPIKLVSKNGIEIILSGKIDRVDMLEKDGEKYIRVIDYKTGKKDFSLSSIAYGLDMQMLLYLFALISDEGIYSGARPAGVLYMPSGRLKCESARDEENDIDKIINSQYKMKGVVLRNRDVLRAMENDIQGVYIPAKLLSADTGESDVKLDRWSSVLTEKQFYRLREHMKELMTNMAELLYDGDISASPLVIGKSDVCKYCSYWDVCGNVPNVRQRAADDGKEVMEAILNGEDDADGRKMD